ncbi:MAG: D-aminoacylase [Bacteroidetes bacterium]|nr:D-aminoacylase [Bacteroidota bacterium]
MFKSIFCTFRWFLIFLSLTEIVLSQSPKQDFSIIILNGVVYDGTNSPPKLVDIGINGDGIAAIGNLKNYTASKIIDAKNMAVAPGFINMLSWATETLIHDPRSMSDITQGVTLEVFGEGWSMGPLSEAMKRDELSSQGDYKFDIPWNSLGEYLEHLEKKGVTPNIASFVGATTLRIYTIGFDNRPPTKEELDTMKLLTKQAMEEGALGVGSSLIYAPAFYANTNELIEICKVAAEYNGMYISHIRSEGNNFLQAVDELIKISKEANIPAEIYHLKAAGKNNWNKIDDVIKKINDARKSGLKISADMYTYTAGATGLDASMPPWVQEGGYFKWVERLKDPEIKRKVLLEMNTPTDKWENLYLSSGSPDNIILVSFKNDSLKYLTGKTLSEVSKIRNLPADETAISLVVDDGSRVGTVYFLMSEENVKKQIKLPWISFGSDAGSLAPEGEFLKSSTHPRAYGNFSRLLGKYVRDEKIIPLEEAIYKLTLMPATNLKIKKRGSLKVGNFADVVIFDPKKIQDHATFQNPHQLSTGMDHVFVNGVQVLDNGIHTGKFPGKVVRGPGWKK